MHRIELIAKSQYGNTRFFPVPSQTGELREADVILRLMRRMSFSACHIDIMKKAGWEVKIKQEKIYEDA